MKTHWSQCNTLNELLQVNWFHHKEFDLTDNEFNLMNVLLHTGRFNSRSDILRLTKQNSINLVNVEDANDGNFNMSPKVKIKIINKIKVSLNDLNNNNFTEFDAVAIGKMPDIFFKVFLRYTQGWRIYIAC